jgi:hypothetical protein
MAFVKLLQPRQQPSGGKRADDTDCHNFLGPSLCEGIHGTAQLPKRLGYSRQQRLSFIGQGQAARHAAKQGDPERLLERLHQMADRCLGYPQFQACLGEAQVACGSFEGAQRVQW